MLLVKSISNGYVLCCSSFFERKTKLTKILHLQFQRIRSCYVSYCSNLINAKELLDAKRCEENGRVEDYLKRCTDSGFSRKLDLWDFLGSFTQT